MTGHAKQLERMTLNADWLRVAGDLSVLCNLWAKRRDLKVYLGRDGGQGIAPAFFQPSTAEIELNSELGFGKGSNGATVGDLTNRLELSKYPVIGGMAMHESGHARYMNADWAKLKKRFNSAREWDVYELLEETRIEGRMALAWPSDVGYLRACTREIIMGPDPTLWSARGGMQLLIGRHEVGILEYGDVEKLENHLEANGWPMKLQDECRKVIADYMLTDDDTDAGIDEQVELALKLDKLMPLDPVDPDQQAWDDLLDAIEEVMRRAKRGGTKQVIESADRGESDRKRSERDQEDRVQKENDKKAQETFENSAGGKSAVPSQLRGARPATSAERGAAVRLSKDLEKAKYRDRVMTEYDTDVPPGRFNGGEAMRKEATRWAGGDTSRFKPFRHQRFQETDEPPLTVGIMSDVSGSMNEVQPGVATAVYVISEAVYRLDKAEAAAVYFGSSVYPGLRKGERLKQVRTWSGIEGWEDFDGGFRALDGELNLLQGKGARLLVVVSDGQYGGAPPFSPVYQAAARDEWVKTCVKNGVGVVWVQIRGQHAPVAETPGVEVVSVGTDILDAIEPIGLAAIRALEHASGR